METTDIDSYQRIVGRMLAMEIGIHRRFTHIVNRAEKDGMD
ncbi:AsnC family transcriptional regulator [Agrobacterium tumefaciens 5A]|nr:AsnC family transcriptional regulator [Agrobacterium tumefaciens 5A]